MFWLKLLKNNIKVYREKVLNNFFHPFEYNAGGQENLFKQATSLMLDVSKMMFNKLDERQKEVFDWVRQKKGYIGFESFFFGEYVKQFLEKSRIDFPSTWQITDGEYLKEYLNQYPEEYDKWVKLVKFLYQEIKNINEKDISQFISEHPFLNPIFVQDIQNREENFGTIKKDLWEKTFDYLKVFFIY